MLIQYKLTKSWSKDRTTISCKLKGSLCQFWLLV